MTSLLEELQMADAMPTSYLTASTDELHERAKRARATLGKRLYILGHHYQKDEVIHYADVTGDSLQLSQIAGRQTADYILFCGVHFMAETADILTEPHQAVILPDMRAGCSMADMANIDQTERAWAELQTLFGDTIIPLTYVNSTAAIKAFVGRNGGATVTSSNAQEMVEWALSQKQRMLFLPDQHLGRNTAVKLGIPLEQMAVWDPIKQKLELDCAIEDVQVILWKGHCSVHMNFLPKHVDNLREKEPDRNILVHPECTYEVVSASDFAGSTKYIIDMIEASEPGSKWAIGTEMNLVNRLIKDFPDRDIVSLNPFMCPCLTMNRIDLPHFTWILEELVEGRVLNRIQVDEQTASEAKLALAKML
ncbi:MULTISPECIES: quinolinate synthase NadA [unclassified Planococcus (in: firmicutes)]|uniref:quinolinate synthase NadA n=2 Tax=Bacteria TaxID=2 RepID=UPI000C327419|nr:MULTISPECIES: quinolinate synthase NadA [unclassified Planococcus (in: firmicutes)]AUD13211.1 quinolinate synthase [Planococcus sp. MB-3u-03]PKG45301.1 quinolinate synthase [Planococcus sp. Urea-trap-24]PKG89103.1 quinolinate synthase [Planococcus sp. Urea-3u-39]PKH39318.1 quinolinate synthase [Planococcus sp. MB-3u-09]